MTRPVEPGNAPLALPPILPAPRKAAPRKAAPRPVAKLPAPRPVSTSSAANPRGVAIAPASRPTVNDRAARTLGTGDNPRGVSISRAPAKGATTERVVKDIFNHQNPKGQAAIYAGILKTKVDPGLNVAVMKAIQGMRPNDRLNMEQFLPDQVKGLDVGKLVREAGHVLSPAKVYGGSGKSSPDGFQGGIGTVTPIFGGQKGGLQILKNTGKDAIDLGPQTIEGIYGIGKEVSKGHFKNALKDLIDPTIQTLTHPAQSFYAHPLITATQFAGSEAALGRGVGAAMRSGALGDAVKAAGGTAREPLRLGPDVAGAKSPIEEARSYSPNAITKAGQVAREKALRKRGIDPNVARPKPGAVPTPLANAMNIGLEAKTRRIADEMTSTRQAAGREHRTEATRNTRMARPHKKAANIVSHILQGVVRTPETAVEDIGKEINRLKAEDQGVRSLKTIQNRRQVRDLTEALRHPEHLSAAFESADKLRAPIHAADAYLVKRGLLDPDQAARAKLIPYAMAHMGAKYDHSLGEFVDAHGNTLNTETILDHIKDDPHGMQDPAYVGHYPAKAGAHQFYQAYKAARGTQGSAKRTGEAFKSGGYDHSFNGLVAQAARTSEAITKAGLHDQIVSRLGIGKPSALRKIDENGYFTPREAKAYARASTHDDNGNEIPGGQRLVPVTAFNAKTPFSAVKDLQSPADLDHVDGLELGHIRRAVEDAAARNDGKRNVVLVPASAINQFERQFKPASGGARKLGQVTQQFKRTVLPYSTHWMMQIGSEGFLRSTLTGVLDPRNLVAGRQLVKHLQTTEEGRNALREMVQASFYNKHDPLSKYNPNPSPIMQVVRHSPARIIMEAHNHYANLIGQAIGGMEHEFRRMGLGKISRRQLQEFTGSYQAGVRLQAKNVALLADKLTSDPALVAKFGRQVDDTFGKYNKLSPKVRAAVQSVAPFLPWYLNAAKFVLWHLPVHHPVASMLMANLRQTINQDIADGKAQPLNVFQTSELARLTPFGLWPDNPTVGGEAQALTDPLLPQVTGAYNVLHGQSVFGDGPLKGPNGDVKAFSNATIGPAVESMLEAVMPGTSQLRHALEGGGTSLGTSTLLHPQTKPGTSGGVETVLNRIFNPIRGVQAAAKYTPQAPAASSAGSGGSGGWGSSSSGDSSGWGSSAGSSGGW